MRSHADAVGDDIVLVDMMNLAFRMTFAHQHLSAGGKPTGATFGVLKTVRDLRENVSKRIVFCWDHGVPVLGAPKPRNWRDGMMNGYKAERKPNDAYADLIPQLAPLHRMLSLLGYSHASVMGLEADDIIGVLSKSAWPNTVKMILSTDKDFYQLFDEEWVRVIVPKKDKGEFQYVHQSDVEREYGIGVSRWAEYLALGGDKSDSIKPMKGMGPKTAIKLIQSGVDLRKPLELQTKEFKTKYGSVWARVQNCYSAARVPTSLSDPRIESCMTADNNNSLVPLPDQRWATPDIKARAMREFTSFLADNGMLSLLADAKSFFDTENRPKCTQTPTGRLPQRPRGQNIPMRPRARLL